MRYIFGIIGVLAALCFVAYAAVTSHHTAAAMTSQFPELAGWAAAGMVCWEALGALYVQQCWRNGSKWMAFGGAVLVLAASIYLLRLDLRFHVAGQSDVAAAREVSVENRDIARSEFDKAVKRRDELQQKKTLTRTEAQDLADSKKRISELEPRLWGTETITAGGVPEANWASRMFSGISSDRQGWADAFMVAGLLFWALARMLALPVAVASMQMAYKPRVDAPGRAKASPATPAPKIEKEPPTVAPSDSETAFAQPALPEPVTPVPTPPSPTPGAEEEVTELVRTDLQRKVPQVLAANGLDERVHDLLTPQQRAQLAKAFKKKHAGKADDEEGQSGRQTVIDWLSDCTSQTNDRRIKTTSGECRESYLAYCQMKDWEPVPHKIMTGIISSVIGKGSKGKRAPRNAQGRIFEGLAVFMPSSEPLRARA